uniref:Ribosomal_L11_N domain-containing protein n=1 Tax=Globodera pallida TaxID=36090 RepID=A0A183CL65_GLOPA
MSPKKIGEDIAKATQDWKGLKVTCKLTIQNRVAKIVVGPRSLFGFAPPADDGTNGGANGGDAEDTIDILKDD